MGAIRWYDCCGQVRAKRVASRPVTPNEEHPLMMSLRRRIAAGVAALSLSASVAMAANPVYFRYTGHPAGAPTVGGVVVGPYFGQFKNGPTVDITCVDWYNRASSSYYKAWLTKLDGSEPLTYTRFGALANALDRYQRAAYLASWFAAPGISASDTKEIHKSIWALFSPNRSGQAGGAPAPSTNYWLDLAQANYRSFDYSNVYVITGVKWDRRRGDWKVDDEQEFLTGSPESVAPEPASMALLGTGLAGVAAARRRKKKEQAEA